MDQRPPFLAGSWPELFSVPNVIQSWEQYSVTFAMFSWLNRVIGPVHIHGERVAQGHEHQEARTIGTHLRICPPQAVKYRLACWNCLPAFRFQLYHLVSVLLCVSVSSYV